MLVFGCLRLNYGMDMSAPSEAGANCPEREAPREWPKISAHADPPGRKPSGHYGLYVSGGNERCGAIEKEIISHNASEGIEPRNNPLLSEVKEFMFWKPATKYA